jgi:hypothetical protein
MKTQSASANGDQSNLNTGREWFDAELMEKKSGDLIERVRFARTLRWREADSNSWSRFEKTFPRCATRFRALRRSRAAPLGGGSKVRTRFRYASDHQFVGDAAYINLEIETLHRRAREIPDQTNDASSRWSLHDADIG